MECDLPPSIYAIAQATVLTLGHAPAEVVEAVQVTHAATHPGGGGVEPTLTGGTDSNRIALEPTAPGDHRMRRPPPAAGWRL